MARLVDVAGLLVLLRFASCEETRLEDTPPPVLHLRLDPGTRTLSWESRANVTRQECRLDAPPRFSTRQLPQVRVRGLRVRAPQLGSLGTWDFTVGANGSYSCHFPNAVLHRGATLTVEGTAEGTPFRSVLEFRNPGPEGSGASNFSCLIHSRSLMQCGWNPGPAAPADVQYRLFGWTSGLERPLECPRYQADARGTRVSCRFDELLGSEPSDAYSFLINGSSAQGPVRFADLGPVRGIQIEKFDPPANLSVRDNGTHHVIRWDPPRLRFEAASHALCFQLGLQREGSSSEQDSVLLRGSEENVYVLPGSPERASHTVRVRVRFVRGEIWSDWTPTVRFGHADQGAGGFPFALMGMVVGAAALGITVLMFLCTRFSLAHKLFPPVPQVKREVTGTAMDVLEVSWDDGAGRPPSLQEAEDFLSVEEVQPLEGGRRDPAGPASAQPLGTEGVGPEPRTLDM